MADLLTGTKTEDIVNYIGGIYLSTTLFYYIFQYLIFFSNPPAYTKLVSRNVQARTFAVFYLGQVTLSNW